MSRQTNALLCDRLLALASITPVRILHLLGGLHLIQGKVVCGHACVVDVLESHHHGVQDATLQVQQLMMVRLCIVPPSMLSTMLGRAQQ